MTVLKIQTHAMNFPLVCDIIVTSRTSACCTFHVQRPGSRGVFQ